MGNNNSEAAKSPRCIKSYKDNHKPTKKDEFIIKHFHKNKNVNSENDTIQSTVDQRRLVFVSSVGLYQSWKQIPSHLLYTALLILPLKKNWIYNHSEFIDNLKISLLSESASSESISPDFIEFLKWKDSQGLVMWCMDHFDGPFPIPMNIQSESTKNIVRNPLIAGFWYQLNDKLCSLYDHITGENYKQLNFDEKWWRNKGKFISKYGTKCSVILAEFYFVTMKHETMCEILYQSNPKSLHPMIVYRERSMEENKKSFAPIKTVSQTNLGFKLKNSLCVMTPLSPIKESKKSKNGSCSVKSNVVDYENAYLKITTIRE